ncbi:MAG: hypothetical protein ACQEQM_07190 [Thermoplasmatota archaeon]
MVGYNPKVLEKYAGRLYIRAYMTIIKWIVIFIFSAYILNEFEIIPLDFDPLFIYVIFGAIGIWTGLFKTLALRAEAQKMLCLKTIEQHLSNMLKQDDRELDARGSSKQTYYEGYTREGDQKKTYNQENKNDRTSVDEDTPRQW